MTMSVPQCRVFFDTQICINAAANKISEADWFSAMAYIQETAEYCVSALTLGEIILSIARGNRQSFEAHQERLRRLCPRGNKTFLDFPEYFLASELGFEVRRPRHLETDFSFSVSVILQAQSRCDLFDGVLLPTGGTAQVRLDRFLDEVDGWQNAYVEWFSGLKGSKRPAFTPEQWATSVISFMGFELNEESVQRFVRACAAGYEYEVALHNLIRNGNYDLRKHVSDLLDAKQLCYLCDPAMVFVTDDTGFKKRLRRNPQKGRIVTFPELVNRAREKQPILQSA